MIDYKFTIFFGDTSDQPRLLARAYDPSACLMDHKNYYNYLDTPSGTVYSSLGDLPKDISVVYKILLSADKIFYCDWDQKVDLNNPSDSQKGFTHYVLSLILKIKKNVYNLDLSAYNPAKYVKLSDTRKNQQPQLWVAGCSMSHGVGVNHNERYGYLLSQRLNRSVSFLTHSGSSIDWAADQILRSDIVKGDIIVWGITSENRLPIWDTKLNHLLHVNFTIAEMFNLTEIRKLLLSDHSYYNAFTHIHQVNNFCNKVEAKLFLFGLLNSDIIDLNLHNLENFIQYKDFKEYKDIGTDNLHPGPMQHQAYADFCQSALKKLQYI